MLQAKDYRGAIAVYTEGIEACLAQKESCGDEEMDVVAIAALYGNRAASFVMILGYEQVWRAEGWGLSD